MTRCRVKAVLGIVVVDPVTGRGVQRTPARAGVAADRNGAPRRSAKLRCDAAYMCRRIAAPCSVGR
ncbi:hypothetical protein WT94_10280 [Burkholderia stagnalis]|nr:hypothetical protein WT76_10725 [Burkholderia stagnalis]KWO27319.1 hypothetical protein WT94_10280 [Burkholderia stagnalis]